MNRKSTNRIRRFLLKSILGICSLCGLLIGISAASNLLLPSSEANADILTEQDKARIIEAIHLRQALGDSVWPGFGSADLPLINYNDQYAFLIGLQNPEPGWIKVPAKEHRGSTWELVSGDTFYGEPYYRQKLTGPDITPEGFAVLVGDQWVASLTTRTNMETRLVEPILANIPAWLHPILPYKLFIRLMLGDSDRYISLIEHEAFHAYQGLTAYPRLEAAENAMGRDGDNYPWETPELKEDWEVEIDLLVNAVQASSQEGAANFARQFFIQREQRRRENGLTSGMIGYERLREWEEGLAKYVQIQILLEAALAPDYQPAVSKETDDNFNSYTQSDDFLKLEISNAKTSSEDTIFYYTGMLEAFLLDRLTPGWKERIRNENVALEDLLSEAVYLFTEQAPGPMSTVP